MKSICLIVPYFGKLPVNFQVWLNSCKLNSTINWVVFTDDNTSFDYPLNVKVFYLSFKECFNYFQACYDFKISLDTPYKLCDYKVAYGEVFNKFITDYDFWGYCDIDLVFGNIRNFLTDNIFDEYDKIFTCGHFPLFRNNITINSTYRKAINQKIKYKEVFSSNISHSFDEWGEDGINFIFLDQKLPMYNVTVFSDILLRYSSFVPAQLINEKKYQKYNCYLWDHGQLFRFFVDTNQNKVCKDEVLYLHLQKRNMKIENCITSDSLRILIIPNKYLEYSYVLDKETLKKFGKNKLFYSDYLFFRLKNLRRKIVNYLKVHMLSFFRF